MKRLIQYIKEAFRLDPAWASFLTFTFAVMVSMPVARLGLVASLICLLVTKNGRKRFSITIPTLGWLAYLAVAIVVSAIAAIFIDDPLLVSAKGFGKIDKLFWYIAIPLTAAMAINQERAIKIQQALVLGALLLSVVIIVGNPVKAWLQVSYPTPSTVAAATGLPHLLYQFFSTIGLDSAICEWLHDSSWTIANGWNADLERPPSFYLAMLNLGSMDDSQRLMVAFVVALGLFPKIKNLNRILKIAILVIIMLALIITCKRGPLLAAVAVSFFILAKRIKIWKTLLLVACLIGAIIAVPSARQRFSVLPQELNPRNGGRLLMWTEIVPVLHEEYPYGIGFRALTDKKMESIDDRVEPNRTHVHSTPLQAFVDFSYLGVVAWLFWMVVSLLAARLTVKISKDNEVSMVAPIFALILFGLVEYNLADAAIVLLYSITMGLASPYYINAGKPNAIKAIFLNMRGRLQKNP